MRRPSPWRLTPSRGCPRGGSARGRWAGYSLLTRWARRLLSPSPPGAVIAAVCNFAGGTLTVGAAPRPDAACGAHAEAGPRRWRTLPPPYRWTRWPSARPPSSRHYGCHRCLQAGCFVASPSATVPSRSSPYPDAASFPLPTAPFPLRALLAQAPELSVADGHRCSTGWCRHCRQSRYCSCLPQRPRSATVRPPPAPLCATLLRHLSLMAVLGGGTPQQRLPTAVRGRPRLLAAASAAAAAAVAAALGGPTCLATMSVIADQTTRPSGTFAPTARWSSCGSRLPAAASTLRISASSSYRSIHRLPRARSATHVLLICGATVTRSTRGCWDPSSPGSQTRPRRRRSALFPCHDRHARCGCLWRRRRRRRSFLHRHCRHEGCPERSRRQ